MQKFIVIPLMKKFLNYATNNVYNVLIDNGVNVQLDTNFEESLNKRILDAQDVNNFIIIVDANAYDTDLLCVRPPNNSQPLNITISQIIHMYEN
jgi:threonyl-tRNA synthetase